MENQENITENKENITESKEKKQKRTAVIMIRATPEEKEIIKAKAKKENRTVTSYLVARGLMEMEGENDDSE